MIRYQHVNIVAIKRSLVAVFLILSCFLQLKADLINLADSAYNAGDYNLSVNLYNQIASEKGVSSTLYYNLGNSYARLGDYGNAMLYYLKSLRLDPSNKQAKENIAYIESKVHESNQSELRGKKYSLEADSPSLFNGINMFIARDHLSDTWAVWSVIFFILFITCAAIYIFTKNVMARKIGFFGGFVFLGFTVIFVIFSYLAANYISIEGVITSPKVKLRTEASIGSKESPVNLTRGTKMKILDHYPSGTQQPQWYKVRLNSDFIGWIQDTDFVPVGL